MTRPIAVLGGARPNFVKIAALLPALAEAGVPALTIHTGQHRDYELSAALYEDLSLPEPDCRLESDGAAAGARLRHMARQILAVLRRRRPRALVVVGDVASTVAGAIAAASTEVVVMHVEAGLRCGSSSEPEEVNRIVTDHLSDYLYAPSDDAVENLLREGHAPAAIRLVGNVMIDTLRRQLPRARRRPVLDELGLARDGFGLVTFHRPSNVDDEQRLRGIVDALARLGRAIPIVWPVHPRTRRGLNGSGDGDGRLRLLPPLRYLDFLALEDAARLVITDSGGVQEETTALGTPCYTLRPWTERPVTVEHGTNRLIGADPRAIAEVDATPGRGVPNGGPPLWDGRAAGRIVEHMLRVV
jgi:UDP-N-acetylglucosamine 2-epimerase (non-hydrolysing)